MKITKLVVLLFITTLSAFAHSDALVLSKDNLLNQLLLLVTGDAIHLQRVWIARDSHTSDICIAVDSFRSRVHMSFVVVKNFDLNKNAETQLGKINLELIQVLRLCENASISEGPIKSSHRNYLEIINQLFQN